MDPKQALSLAFFEVSHANKTLPEMENNTLLSFHKQKLNICIRFYLIAPLHLVLTREQSIGELTNSLLHQ